MTYQLNNAVIRELSDDELGVVAGAKPMVREAVRYNARPPLVEIGLGLIKKLISDPDVVSVQEVTCTNITYDDGSSDFTCRPK